MSRVSYNFYLNESAERKLGQSDDNRFLVEEGKVLLDLLHDGLDVTVLIDVDDGGLSNLLPGRRKLAALTCLTQDLVQVILYLLILSLNTRGIDQSQSWRVETNDSGQVDDVVELVDLTVRAHIRRSPVTDALDVHVLLHLPHLFKGSITFQDAFVPNHGKEHYFIIWDGNADSDRWSESEELHVLCVERLELAHVGDEEADFHDVGKDASFLGLLQDHQHLVLLRHGLNLLFGERWIDDRRRKSDSLSHKARQIQGIRLSFTLSTGSLRHGHADLMRRIDRVELIGRIAPAIDEIVHSLFVSGQFLVCLGNKLHIRVLEVSHGSHVVVVMLHYLLVASYDLVTLE